MEFNISSSLSDHLRGEIHYGASMAKHTWFGVGGEANAMFSPRDIDDLINFLRLIPLDVPLYPLGAGSNLLVRDGGINGIVINMEHFNTIEQENNTLLVGAGAYDAEVARKAAHFSIGGLEFLIGIPGTIGGGLRMNAGAYGVEFKDVVLKATAVDRQGNIHHATPSEMQMSYRHSEAPADWFFISATLKTRDEKTDIIRARMKEIISSRGDAQPRGVRTGGSTFANPASHKAWQLIDTAGCRGLQDGHASVSEKHCNFLINNGGATATELERLGETVRQRVKNTSDINLRWEIKRIGRENREQSR